MNNYLKSIQSKYTISNTFLHRIPDPKAIKLWKYPLQNPFIKVRLRPKLRLFDGPKTITLYILLNIRWNHLYVWRYRIPFYCELESWRWRLVWAVVNVGSARQVGVSVNVKAGATVYRTYARWTIVGDQRPLCFEDAPRKGVHLPNFVKVTHVNFRDDKDYILPIVKNDTLYMLF